MKPIFGRMNVCWTSKNSNHSRFKCRWDSICCIFRFGLTAVSTTFNSFFFLQWHLIQIRLLGCFNGIILYIFIWKSFVVKTLEMTFSIKSQLEKITASVNSIKKTYYYDCYSRCSPHMSTKLSVI